MRIWGGVIATLLFTSALFAPLNVAYAFNYDPLTNTYKKLECTMQSNKCVIKSNEGRFSTTAQNNVFYDIKYDKFNKYDFTQNSDINGIAFKTPDKIDPNKNYVFNFIGNGQHLLYLLEGSPGIHPDVPKMASKTANHINITTTGTVDFTFAQIKNLINTDFSKNGSGIGDYSATGSAYITWGDMITVNNSSNKDVNLTILDIQKSKNFVIDTEALYTPYIRDNNFVGLSNGAEDSTLDDMQKNNTLFFRSEISNPTANSTNYTLHAKDSSLYLHTYAHFYSSEIAGKNDKYGVFLEDSELTIGTLTKDLAHKDIGLDGSVNISHLVNNDSKINLYTDVIGRYTIQQKRRKSYLDFAYSKTYP